jgi:hypothetical protein
VASLSRGGECLGVEFVGALATRERTMCVLLRSAGVTGVDYFVRGATTDTAFDGRRLVCLAVSAVLASALLGAGWWVLSPPFAIALTSFP